VLAAAVNEAQVAVGETTPRTSREGEQEMMEQRLIDKLPRRWPAAAGLPGAGLAGTPAGPVLRRLAILGRFEPEQVKRTLDSDRPSSWRWPAPPSASTAASSPTSST